jgi:dihydroxyacetone kinase-like protein
MESQGEKERKYNHQKKIVGNILDAILDDLKPENNEKMLLFVNGMGGTPLTELYLVYDDACKILQSKGVEVTRSLVGNYCTSLEMQGASITLLKCDEEILKNWDAPVHTAAMRWGM